MIQKAQLQQYAEEGGPTQEPSTPVIITGGGPVIDDSTGVRQVVNIGSHTVLPFKVAEVGPAANTWVASRSEKQGQVTQVTVGGKPIGRLTHPVVLSFRDSDDQPLLEISEATDVLGAQLMISVYDGVFDITTPGNEPSTWLASDIPSHNLYAKLFVNDDQPVLLSTPFSVSVEFDQV